MSSEITKVSAIGFEIETCSRCGGTGNYSYCQSYGTRCFKCHGKRVVLTARGAAAAAFYGESLKVPAGSLAVGEKIQVEMMSISGEMSMRYFAPIVSIEPSRTTGKSLQPDGSWKEWPPMIEITTEHPKHGRSGLHTWAEFMVRKAWPAEAKAAKLAAAIAFQATLTKAGSVRKAAKAAQATA